MDKNNIDLSSMVPSRAILKAVDNEPIIRWVSRRPDGTIMVRSERSYLDFLNNGRRNHWIGWHQRDVYSYDPSVFEELSQLYVSGNRDGLNEAWQKLKHHF